MAVVSTTGVSLAAAGVAFVVNILMARQLGPSSRGEVALVLQSAYVLAPVLALGLDRQALRGADSMGGTPRVRHVWITAAVLAVAAALAGSLTALACVGIAACTAYVSIERGVGMARRSLVRFVVVALGLQAWILGASVALFLAEVDDVRWWLGVYVAPAVALLLLTLASRRHPDQLVGPSRTSLVYMAGGLAALLAGRVERLLLPVLSSSRQLGLYMAIATTSEMIAWAARGLGESRVKDFVENRPNRRSMARLAARDAAIFVAAAIPVALGLFYVVIPLLGPGFDSSRPLVIPLCAASVAWCVYLQMSSRWLGSASSLHSLGLDATTTVVTAGLVVALVPSHGALGAAYACLGSYVVMSTAAVAFFPRPTAPTSEYSGPGPS
ncbi:hypothetical protein ASD11_11315 [Aeromicrobium sp. Root495]|nr:hypothetical protein ASD11_11315 [Aeromicrobium sp. Root495]